MTNKKWKLLAWVLMLSLCFCKPAYAATSSETELVPMTIESRKTVDLTLSSGNATSSCTVIGAGGKVTKITIYMYLQKQNSSGGWSNYKTWSGTKSDNNYTLSKTTAITKGTYRVRASVTCYQGTSSETTSEYSTVKTY